MIKQEPAIGLPSKQTNKFPHITRMIDPGAGRYEIAVHDNLFIYKCSSGRDQIRLQ